MRAEGVPAKRNAAGLATGFACGCGVPLPMLRERRAAEAEGPPWQYRAPAAGNVPAGHSSAPGSAAGAPPCASE